MPDKKYFPIKTNTACQLKWAWSTLYLNNGVTGSCHRTAMGTVAPENFMQFHNTPLKIQDRQQMLQGLWPEDSCAYCRKIEEVGGTSDRMRHLSIPDMSPPELEHNLQAVNVSPTLLEVYFSSACNMGCLYCPDGLSSTNTAENNKFKEFKQGGVHLPIIKNKYKDYVPLFWEWFPDGFPKLKRLGILGGEPLIQQEFDYFLEMVDKYPNPNCQLNIVTNLMVSPERLASFIPKFRKLLVDRKIARIDISVSIDCWGPQQEYVRYGIDLKRWEENFRYLMQHKWLYLMINQTISVLTIKTMPELLMKLIEWRKERKIGHWFSGVEPGPTYLKAGILPGDVFEKDMDTILSLLPTDTDEDCLAYEYMKGIFQQICQPAHSPTEIRDLFVFLEEKDRRRGTDWTVLFPWLVKYRKYVV
jgi:pyruvate-formate lyase-activating enzyme